MAEQKPDIQIENCQRPPGACLFPDLQDMMKAIFDRF